MMVHDLGRAAPGRNVTLVSSFMVVAAFVALVLPFSSADLGGRPGFVPALLAIVVSFDLLSAVLLARQFTDSGDRRALVLASSYVFSLVVLAGHGAAFPGVLADVGPLGGWPSTAPWLYVVWHTGFPVLLAAAVAPWPQRWSAPAPVARRRSAVGLVIGSAVVVSAALVVAAATGSSWLPVLIAGSDTTAMTRVTAPVVLPLVSIATLLAVTGAVRLSGPTRWAALAAVVALGDLVLAYFSFSRFSAGWYAGRSLTIVASAVVLVAMLAEFSRLKRQLAEEAVLLRSLLSRTEELEGQHTTLLKHMSSGVVLHGQDGRVITSNPAASSMLGLSIDQLEGREPFPPGWSLTRPDGSPCPGEDTPPMITLRTGQAQRQQMIGIELPDGERRWLRVSTSPERGGEHGEIRYVVSSMVDETERHQALLTASKARATKHRRVQQVLDGGGPQVVVQPIVDLRTGAVVGGEALSRFHHEPHQGPDRWFSDADEVGRGTELELAAVSRALGHGAALPPGAYLSVNVSPVTAASPELAALLAASSVPGNRLVVELTEHTGVANYPALSVALDTLRRLGVRIAIDDAGSGFASMRHILMLDPHIVKLDVDLVRDIHIDPARRALAAGLLIFADQIGASLIAEGIESEQELAALLDVGIQYGQGFFLGRPSSTPLPATVRIEQLLRDPSYAYTGRLPGPE